MPHPLPYPELVLGLLAGLILFSEKIGLAALLSGLVLFNRNLAHTHVTIFGWPLYAVETVLMVWIARVLIFEGRQRCRRWQSWPIAAQALIVTWFVWCAFEIVRSLLNDPPMIVMRDSALMYYAVFLLLSSTLAWTESSWRRLLQTLAVVLLFKTVLMSTESWFDHTFTALAVFHGQPAALSLVLATGILYFWILLIVHWRWSHVAGATALAACLMLETVRSSWTGLISGAILLFWLAPRIDPAGVHARRRLLTGAVISFVSAIAFIRLLDADWLANLPKRLMPPKLSTPAPVSLPVNTAPNLSLAPSKPVSITPSTLASAPAPEPKHMGKPVSIPAPASPAVVPHKRLGSTVLQEFRSFFEGKQSANVMTRLWMWRDAFQELTMTGLFYPAPREEDMHRYNLRMDERFLFKNLLLVPVYATGLEHITLKIRFDLPEPDPWQLALERAKRLAMGMGFGKLFLPPEIVWLVMSPNRYDPHNSMIHLVYRTGLIGLFLFIAIVTWVFRTGLRELKASGRPLWQRQAIAAALAGLATHGVHGLTDNALENPFKAIWFWLQAGLILYLVYGNRTDAPSSRS